MKYMTYKYGLIVFVILTLVSNKTCSAGCFCNQEMYNCNFQVLNGSINFTETNLLNKSQQNQGTFHFSNTRQVNSSIWRFPCMKYDERLRKLPPKIFECFNRLKDLEVFNCYFEYIDEDVFTGLNTLTRLSIQGIPNLPIRPKTFRHIPNLEILEIKDSYWYGLSSNILCMLTKIRSLQFPRDQIGSISDVFKLCTLNESVFNKVTKLNLEFNQIERLEPSFSQRMTNLEILSLKGNKIREIQNGALANLSRLRILDLSGNNLRQLPDDFLSGCPLVKTLRISNNLISKLPSSIGNLNNLEILEAHSTLLTDINLLMVNSLRKLDIHNSSQTTIPTRLCRNNPNLEHLDLGQNNILSVPGNIFKNCKRLQELFLSSNNISMLSDDSFKGLGQTSYLDLSNNHISSCGGETFQNMWDLKMLNLSSNSLRKIPSISSNVHYFDISYNKITRIVAELHDLKSLTHFYAQHNLMSTIWMNFFAESIIYVNLANNRIQTVESISFEDLNHLETVNLQMNKIERFEKPHSFPANSRITSEFYISGNQFQCDCELIWLKEIIISPKLSKPLIFVDQKNVTCFKHGKDWLPDGPFHKIELNSFVCRYYDSCPTMCICTEAYHNKVNNVDCKNRNITDGTGISSYAKSIDLSGNDMGSLTNKSFNIWNVAKILYLNNSKIITIAERTFTAFIFLKELYLECNEIRILFKDSLVGLSDLKRLILKYNKIERILPGTFRVTPRLEVLDLSYNKLKKIDSRVFIVNSLQKIVLRGNPWSCNCDDIKYISELSDNRSSLIDSKYLICSNIRKTIFEYNKECYPKIKSSHFYGVIIGLGLILVVLITGALLYFYRIEIQILFFVRFGWRLVFKRNQLDEEEKMFDAFVSYHNSLDDFVVYEMFPRLEGTNPAYKLCVHFRDFPAGAAIVDNITESIANSKRTILLLNDEFLGSEWCKYEFQAAHFEALSNKLNTLIVVLLEDVNPDLVYGGLKLYLKTRTYLRYDDPRFWDRLRFALPDIKEVNPTNQESSL